MTTHLFPGHLDGDVMVVTSGITLCCHTHSLGIPRGDTGTVIEGESDCGFPPLIPASNEEDDRG